MSNKIFSAALLTAVIFAGCKKETVPTPEFTNVSSERKAMVMDFTGLQCGICAGMLPSWNSMLNDHKNNVIGLSVHCGVSDTLDNNFSLWFANDFNVPGTPGWAEGKTMLSLQSFDDMKAAMEATLTTKADLGIGVKKTISGNTISISTRTVLFNELSGEYNIAVYVLENGCLANQLTTPMIHDHVLRGSANGRYGSLLFNGSKSRGEAIDQSFTYNIGTLGADYWNTANLHVVVVVYKMNNGTAKEVMNCNWD
jgi:hypothetical protein